MKTLKATFILAIVMILNVSFSFAQSIQRQIRLVITNTTYTDEMLIGFYGAALDGYDPYDSEKMAVNATDYPELYAFAGTNQVAIDGLPLLAVGDVKEIQLGYRISSACSLSIRVKSFLNLDSGTVVILKDKVLGIEKELAATSEYTFSTTKGETNNRFSLVLKRMEVVQPATTTTTSTTTTTTTDTTTSTTPATTDNTSTTTTSSTTEPVVTQPIATIPASTEPDFDVLVTSNRTLEVQLINLAVKGTKITVNSINGRRISSVSATSTLTSLNTPLGKGQYIVTVNNKSFSKSKNIVVY